MDITDYGTPGPPPQRAGMMGDPNAPLLDDAMLERLQKLAAKFGSATKDDERQARGIGLLTAALGTLASRTGNPLEALGQGGLLGVAAQQNTLRSMTADRGAGMGQALELIKMQGALQGQQRAAQIQAQLAAVGQGGGPPGAGGAAPPNGQAMQAAALNQADIYEKTAEIYRRNGDPENAKRMIDAANAIREKFSQSPQTRLVNGQPQAYVLGERGSIKDLPAGYAPPTPLHFADTGGAVNPLSPYTGAPAGAPIPKTVDPGTIYSGNITMRGQNMADKRAQEAQAAGPTAKDLAALTTTLSEHVNGLDPVKNFRAASTAAASIKNAPQDTAGDLQVMLNYVRALVPGGQGVSRGTLMNYVKDIETAAQARSGEINNVIYGNGRLSPETRARMAIAVTSQTDALKQGAQMAIAPVVERVKNTGVNMKEIIPPDLRNDRWEGFSIVGQGK